MLPHLLFFLAKISKPKIKQYQTASEAGALLLTVTAGFDQHLLFGALVFFIEDLLGAPIFLIDRTNPVIEYQTDVRSRKFYILGKLTPPTVQGYPPPMGSGCVASSG